MLTPAADPSLCRLMPAVLHTLTDRKDLRNSDIYLLSAVTALQCVIETLPHFISPYLQDVISQASEASDSHCTTAVNHHHFSCHQLSAGLQLTVPIR